MSLTFHLCLVPRLRMCGAVLKSVAYTAKTFRSPSIRKLLLLA
jgi:hypothetical protein